MKPPRHREQAVIDPPFITREVWEKYAVAANMLLKPQPPAAGAAVVVAEARPGEEAMTQPSPTPCGRVLCTTIVENRCAPATFPPTMPRAARELGG